LNLFLHALGEFPLAPEKQLKQEIDAILDVVAITKIGSNVRI